MLLQPAEAKLLFLDGLDPLLQQCRLQLYEARLFGL
jgi:hypothetical protein